MKSNSKILITGASGFVGTHTCAQIKDKRCVVRTNEVHQFKDYFEVSTIDSHTDWSGAFNGVEVIIHIAGLAHSNSYSQTQYNDINLHGTLHLAREARKAGVTRLVFVSSIGVNGTMTYERPFSCSDEPRPHDDYSHSKYAAEVSLKEISEESGFEVVIVRPTLVYGSNAPGNFGMLTKLVYKVPFLPFGMASNCRDFIAVQNLADLLITCANHPDAAGHTFLASESETVSIKEFTNAIAAGLGKKVIQLPVPVSVMRLVGKLTGKAAMIEQLYGNLEVDSSNIKEVLSWTPPLTMKQAMATLRDSGVK